MSERPFTDELLTALAREHGTPLFVYDAATVRARVEELAGHFDVVRYAQKANGNLALLRLVRAAGCAVDAVSAGEVERALAAGFAPEEIVFTSDLFDRAALETLRAHPTVRVNLGSADMLAPYAALDVAREVWLRVNPGFGSGHGRKVTTGGEHSKHGLWHADLARAVAEARMLGLEVTGLHVHIGSGAELGRLLEAARALGELALRVGRSLTVLSAGGGLSIPYRPGEERPDVARLARGWRGVQRELERELDRPLALELEPGRYLVAEAGVLVTEVRGTKRNGSLDFALVDAGFHNLARPALYGAYHAITALGAARERASARQVVAGPLCESADVFTQDAAGNPEPRLLPRLVAGDLVCLHDAGAYGSAMGSNYNSQPRAAEVLVEGGVARLVRRRERPEELWRAELET